MKTVKIGQKFGKLKVISLKTSMVTSEGKPSKAYVVCRCSCGNEVSVDKVSLLNGVSKHCRSMNCIGHYNRVKVDDPAVTLRKKVQELN